MKDFSESVNEFLNFRRFKILEGKGNVSRKDAEKKAFYEYDIFNKTQKIESDFDKEIKKMTGRSFRSVFGGQVGERFLIVLSQNQLHQFFERCTSFL